MHVCQIILIEADNPLEAFESVYEKLSESDDPNWADWDNVIDPNAMNYAGRWSNAVFFTPNKNGEPDPDVKVSNHLCYADEPALAEMVIEKYLQQRLDDIRRYQSEATDILTATYNPYAKNWELPIYYAKKLADLLNDNWTPDSGVYDLVDWTPNLVGFLQRVKDRPEKQYLIPVDFHF